MMYSMYLYRKAVPWHWENTFVCYRWTTCVSVWWGDSGGTLLPNSAQLRAPPQAPTKPWIL